jgi:FeS assembly SUF system regulator
MIRLTNLADYAVVLMWTMGSRPAKWRTAQQLAQETNIPLPTVSKILNALSRAGLLVSHRGLKGGFELARGADTVTVADIIEAVDGPIALTNCITHSPGECSIEHLCAFRPHWQTINHAIRTSLAGITLEAMLAPSQPTPLTPAH